MVIKNALHATGEFYRAIYEDFMWAIITLLAIILAYFDIFHLEPYIKTWTGITSGSLLSLVMNFVYIPIVLMLSGVVIFLINLIRESFWANQSYVKLMPVNNIKTSIANDAYFAFSDGVGLKIYNPNPYEISKCFATLESLERVVIQNEKLVCVKGFYDQIGLQYSNKLRWANTEIKNTDCEITLAAESKENIVLIANFINRSDVSRGRGKKIKVGKNYIYFNFAFCGMNQGSMYHAGLFKIKIRINGKIPSKPDKSDVIEFFEGYIYSYIKEISPFLQEFDIYWSKEPLKDQRIIKDSWVLEEKQE
jgi:hypothetical protein